ncbi:ribosome recycling factor [Campylobacter fetus]|uniref:Ribosome-recycling factor n=3 Tax=Campylobacter fetus TaxID=196 RepID=RRF_CAMFF|nr:MULTISPECIES: ribosome recycling factor [Campylobacter]A0RRR3.1 RecName: Full=Ribosome-recycling factor; Short=RRF; AltName: Full=Ribosome-releasing factor [Campylobacter fetus subsp. fetus 82-40]OCS22052.1 ribosome recycling factor [Campylobacter fetus subsp. venerealis cfvi97/532]OCS25542.1 ribosome recycling factor [Campylobacter fetus subsp. venerealis cfvB10]OCS29032.1 ribosome recycling factor [Campylobacter fetus subsp. venerealis LMG 6570 = CCUG 33900]OCS42502.1 ribosome recycling f
MLDEIYKNQKAFSDKALEVLKRDFTTLRTGKVNINIVDHINVDYYGSPTALNQVATVLATDASTISISPWEKTMLKAISSAIQAANIGVNPNNDGDSVKLFFPPMTTEDRQKNAKEARSMGEKAKVAIRNIRKDANDDIKKIEKDKSVSEDEIKKGYDEVQKITDSYISKIDQLVKDKEAELLKV